MTINGHDDDFPARRTLEDMQEGGYVRIWRRIWWSDSMSGDWIEQSLWAYMISMVEFKRRARRSHGKCPIEVWLEPGEMVTSLTDLAQKSGRSRHAIDAFLKRLEASNRVEIRAVKRDSDGTVKGHLGIIIKLLNYKLYQGHRDDAISSPGRERDNLLNEETLNEPTQQKADRSLTLTPPNQHSGMPAEEPDFDTWWSCWRKVGTSGRGSTKRGKGHAEPGWRAAIKGGADPGHLCRAVGEYLDWAEAMGYAPDKIKHPATWLSAKAWLDDLPDPQLRTMDHAPRRRSQIELFGEALNQRAAGIVNNGWDGDGCAGRGADGPLPALASNGGDWDGPADLP